MASDGRGLIIGDAALCMIGIPSRFYWNIFIPGMGEPGIGLDAWLRPAGVLRCLTYKSCFNTI